MFDIVLNALLNAKMNSIGFYFPSLCGKCPNTEFFLVCIFPYLDQKNFRIGHLSRSSVKNKLPMARSISCWYGILSYRKLGKNIIFLTEAYSFIGQVTSYEKQPLLWQKFFKYLCWKIIYIHQNKQKLTVIQRKEFEIKLSLS